MTKDVNYYISKGLDTKMAEYYAAGRRKIIAVTPKEDFTLLLNFDNGEQRLFDCKPFLKEGTVFEPFLLYDNFKRVYLDEEHCVSWDIDPQIDSSKVWGNKVDISPDTCYVESIPTENINKL